MPMSRMSVLAVVAALTLAPVGLAGASVGTRSASQGVDAADVRALAIDPKNPAILYAATTGGIFRTTNGGRSWRSVRRAWTRGAEATRQPSIGLGEDLRVRTEDAIGSGLELDGEVVQLSAFRSEDGGRRAFGGIARPSRRR